MWVWVVLRVWACCVVLYVGVGVSTQLAGRPGLAAWCATRLAQYVVKRSSWGLAYTLCRQPTTAACVLAAAPPLLLRLAEASAGAAAAAAAPVPTPHPQVELAAKNQELAQASKQVSPRHRRAPMLATRTECLPSQPIHALDQLGVAQRVF